MKLVVRVRLLYHPGPVDLDHLPRPAELHPLPLVHDPTGQVVPVLRGHGPHVHPLASALALREQMLQYSGQHALVRLRVPAPFLPRLDLLVPGPLELIVHDVHVLDARKVVIRAVEDDGVVRDVFADHGARVEARVIEHRYGVLHVNARLGVQHDRALVPLLLFGRPVLFLVVVHLDDGHDVIVFLALLRHQGKYLDALPPHKDVVERHAANVGHAHVVGHQLELGA